MMLNWLMLTKIILPNKLLSHLIPLVLVLLTANACSAGEVDSESKNKTIAVKFIDIKKENKDKNSGRVWKKFLHIPKVYSEDEKFAEKINNKLKQVVDGFSCFSNGDEEFSSKITSQTNKIISIKYEAIAECEDMPGPFSHIGGINLDAVSGNLFSLSDEVPNEIVLSELSKIIIDEAISELGKKDKELESICPAPAFSGEFYFINDKIVFLEFFPEHSDSPCEIEVQWSRKLLNRYLRENSNLVFELK